MATYGVGVREATAKGTLESLVPTGSHNVSHLSTHPSETVLSFRATIKHVLQARVDTGATQPTMSCQVKLNRCSVLRLVAFFLTPRKGILQTV